ncbi:signal recognition particle-docking protein FtsY [Gloeothece verrucosa]|uniref:Signal recognition particle receptor FtsY n=1 Tax=Gloeothece verrucosa (strain PCC 7822) TaxID=497965 RepID=E0UIM4_GLOV7|nr:signal recognition particle-docking protein FtsY [Gloeothece verrucosa]ADN12218.1 signal recognition particle-docking protein FtsY [Gloeothece verrucosa PCC 7822]
MFNWFRRQKETTAKTEPEKPVSEPLTPEAQPVQAEPEPEKAASGQEEYLNWAKTAFKNIQQRKSEETVELTPSAETPAQELTTTSLEEIKTPEPTVGVSDTPSEAKLALSEPSQAVPAWMKKSDRLDILKETATDTPLVQEQFKSLSFDDDFVWSAQVLAKQGRAAEDVTEEEINWLKRLREGLGKTRRSLVNQLKAIVGQGPLNQDAVTEIEALLLQADVGIEATDYIIEALQEKLREESLPPEQAIEYLKEIIREILDRPFKHFEDTAFEPEKDVLNIWLLTGVNGAGKTTTIGKLAHMANKSGYSCLIVAADTFRAAAVEQVKIWGERSGTEVIANPGKNTDPAAVVFDGINAAQSRNVNLLLVDTAGRLQNKKNLMDELAKIRRIIDKKAPKAKVESLLVLDATLGQNGLRQAQVFSEAAKLSGVVLTKLDGTAKGGVALAVAQQLDLPIRFIGAGEGIEDLRPFSSYEFVEALLNG